MGDPSSRIWLMVLPQSKSWILAEDKSDFRQFRKQSFTQVRLSILLESEKTLPHLAFTARASAFFS